MRCIDLPRVYTYSDYVDDVNPLQFQQSLEFQKPAWAPREVESDDEETEEEYAKEEVKMDVSVHIFNNGPAGETHGDVDGGVFFVVELNLTPGHSGQPYKFCMTFEALCYELGVAVFDYGCLPTMPSKRF